MTSNPLAPTWVEVGVGIYTLTVCAALLATGWALATRRISRTEAVLAIVLTLVVPAVGSLGALVWLLTAKAPLTSTAAR